MESALPVLIPPLAVAIAVVIAAGLAWAVATPLIRAAEGPTLPERLLQWSGQHRFVGLLAYLPAVFSGRHAAWALPVAWLGLQITTHRVRRRVFGDTWSFAGQVWWKVRAFLAMWAWWWTLMLLPVLLIDAGARPALTIALGVVLFLWLYFYNDVLGAILGARPIVAPTLLDAFEPILAKARVRRPRLVHAGPRGGLLVNAFALGAMRGDTVLFFDGLLDEMPPTESAAVLAHEIGHLEDFARRRWQVYSVAPLLVTGAVTVTLGIQQLGWPAWLAIAWCPAPLLWLVLRVTRSQQRENESDARAVELCGDGEALIRALAAIHSQARVPRRFHPTLAERATHPSLARRIQAIRAAGGVAPAPIEPRAFAGDGVPRGVLFEAERIVFVAFGSERPDLGDLASVVLRAAHVDAIPYAELSSLHIEPRRDGAATLVATERHGAVHRLRLASGDLGAVQALMDLVDQRLGPMPAAPRLPKLVGRAAALAAFLAATPWSAWGVMAMALLGLIRPTAPTLSAIAGGLLATAALAARHPSTTPLVPAPVLGLIGLAASLVAIRQFRRDLASQKRFRWDGFLFAAFVVTAAAALIPLWLIVALGYTDLGRLHAAARAFAAAAAGFTALGALCVVVPRRLARIAAVTAFTLSAAVAAVGSDAFRDRVVPDPLIAPAPPVVVRDLDVPANGTIRTAGTHSYVTLAADAQHVLLIPGESGERYTVAGFDGWQRDIDAADAMFVDAATLLVARWEKRTLVLSTEAVRAAAPRWAVRIEDAPRGHIDVDASGRWRVDPDFDPDDSADDASRVEGRVGETAFTRTPLPMPRAASGILPDRSVAASGAVIAVTREFAGSQHRLSWLLPDLAWRSVLERIGGTAPGVLARSRLALDCYGPSMTSTSATCLARTGDDTFVWEVPADAGSPRPLAALTGRVVGETYEERALLLWSGQDLLMLWRGTNDALRIARHDRCPCPHDGSYASGQVVTLTRVGDRDVVVRYPMSPPDAAAAN
jgi:Zn-dependent protease with chaperone function